MNALLIVLAMLFVFPAPASVGIIGGADGPTAIFTTSETSVIGGADGATEIFTASEADVIGGADGTTETFTASEADTITVIGGADGPTAVFVSGGIRLLPALHGFLGILFASAGR